MKIMNTLDINYSMFRQNMANYLDQITNDHVPAKITRQKHESCIVMSEADYNSLIETLHLLKSSANAERLYKSLDEYKNGENVTPEIDWEQE